MNRRTFTKSLALSALAFGTRSIAREPATQFSITMDDFNWQNAVKLTGSERNDAILKTLRSHSLKGALFVVGRYIESPEGKQLLSAWDKAGHLIGNHTYSHPNYNAPDVVVADDLKDILRAEALLKAFPHFRKYFRFPGLKEGDTAEKRDAMRLFLAQNNYRTGHVTIDNSDWLIANRLNARLKKDAAAM